MKGWGVLLAAGIALALLLVAASSAAADPTNGFAAYQVSASTLGGAQSALVNETVGPSPRAGFSDLILQVYGSQQNLTYSRLVNASYDLLPYFPGLGTQSFDYSNGTVYSVHANVTASGTDTLAFGGAQYTMDVISIAVSGSYGTRAFTANGTVETFPSGLVYSASVGNGTYEFQAVLQGTDLPLTAAPPVSSTAAYAGAGVGAGAIALGGVLLIRRRSKKSETNGEKPLHWVD